MRSSELFRVRFAFGLLGVVPVFLFGWLGWVQVLQAGSIERPGASPLPLVAKTADRQGWRRETVPAPRGSVVDRHGVTLAADQAAYEVRANIRVPRKCRDDVTVFRAWMQRLVERFSLALVADPEESSRNVLYARHSKRLARVMGREWRVKGLPETGKWPAGHPRTADFLLCGGVDRLAVINALRAFHMSDDYPTVVIDFLHSFRRVYPERELTHGIVGHCVSNAVDLPGGGLDFRTVGVCGLESFVALEPDVGGSRRYLADGRRRPYFVAPVEGDPEGAVLHATLDLELQRAAVRELSRQCDAGMRNNPDKKAKWGALVLVEIETGDLLAAASWHRGDRPAQATSFAPYQNLFEPGSIVKPLVLSYAHEVGALDWSDSFDCNPRSSTYRDRIASLGRRKGVRDDHDCGVLTPHGILVNSSNIGAAYVGLLLTREQWQDYMGSYGIGRSLGLRLPNESRGGNHPRSFASDIKLRSFRANSVISFSFGYEMTVTAMQVARAYLRMFRGLGADLRLVRGLEMHGRWHATPPKKDTGPHYRPEVVEAIRKAMTDVVSNDPHATGQYLHARMLKETGVDLNGLIGGKTGTAASTVGLPSGKKISARNASFVGFMPADNPRWLAVCVLQKDDSARFYGGSYAAPPAVRLLLQCQRLLEHRPLRQGPRVGSGGQTRNTPSGVMLRSPGNSGWNAAAGAGAFRDTR